MNQREQVLEQLNQFGEVSRNWALKSYISRLSAIIYDLKKDGYIFKEELDGGDYIYVLKQINSKTGAMRGDSSDLKSEKVTCWQVTIKNKQERARITRMPKDKKGRIMACK